MVNRINRNVGLRSDTLTQSDTTARGPLLSRNTHSKNDPPVDEVIAHLANAHENRRARQVTEWERMFRGNVQRAA